MLRGPQQGTEVDCNVLRRIGMRKKKIGPRLVVFADYVCVCVSFLRRAGFTRMGQGQGQGGGGSFSSLVLVDVDF